MLLPVIHSWPLFCIAFGLMLIITFVMSLQSAHFYTNDNVIYKFSIMDLELAATPVELVNLIKGLSKLPDPALSKKAVSAVKGQLYVDFLFMPLAYGSIFFLSMLVAGKMQLVIGVDFFIVMAWLQALAWVCDIIENIYLLRKVKSPVLTEKSARVHKAYLYMEAVKWGLSLVGAICCISAICYFWLAGQYSGGSLYYLLIVIGEIAVFLLAAKLFMKKSNSIIIPKASNGKPESN